MPRDPWWAGVRAWISDHSEYLTTTGLAIVVAQTWGRPGRHIGTGDVLPFVRDSLAASVPDLWGYQLTGAGSPSYEVARLLDLVFLRGAGLVGLGPDVAQRAFYTFLAILAATGGTYLAATFTRRWPVRVAAGAWALVNPYWLVLIPNPIFLLAIGLGTLSAGFLVRAAQGRPPPLPAVVLVSCLISYLAINPPLLAVMVIWVLALIAAGRLLGGTGGFRRALSFATRAVPGVVAVNLFWLVPAIVVFSSPSTLLAAELSPEAWSWTHAQNTVANVFALNAHWGWAFPDSYYPFATRLDRSWFSWMRFAVPVLAAVAPLVCRGRHRRVAAGAVIAALITGFLAKGLHAPLAGANLWFYDHVPGAWLLREPMSKLGWVMVVSYLVAGVLGADRLLELTERRALHSRLAPAALVVAIVAAVTYAHPLWTGEAVPAERANLSGSFVQIPDEWRDVADAIDTLDDGGSVLLLPLPTFYQMDHRWGYYGTDQVPVQLIERRTVHMATGGYFGHPPAYEASVRRFAEALLAGDESDARRLAEAMGVSTVVVRYDYNAETSQPTLTEPKLLSAALEALEGARRVLDSSVAEVWQLPFGQPRLTVATQVHETDGLTADTMAMVVASTPPGSAVIPAGSLADSSLVSRSWVVTDTGADLEITEETDLTLELTGSVPPSWLVTPLPRGVEVAPANLVTINGVPAFWDEPETHSVDGTAAAIGIGGQVLLLDGSVIAPGLPGTAVTVFGLLAETDLTEPRAKDVEDCYAYDDRSTSEAGLSLEFGAEEVVLSAAAHSACVRFALPDPVGSEEVFTVTVNASHIEGSPPRMCVFDTATSACLRDGILDEPNGVLTATVPATPGLEVYLYADEPPPGETVPTVAAYQYPQVRRLAPVETILLPDLPDVVSVAALPAGRHRITTTSLAGNDGPLPLLSPVEDCNRSDDRSPEEAGLRASFVGEETVRLEALAHSACVWTSYGRPSFGSLRVSFAYRTMTGVPPRVCLWQVGPDRCADMPPLDSTDEWTHFEAVVHPDTEADEIRLFLYADAPPDQLDAPTIVEYRDPTVIPVAPWTIIASTAGVAPPPITLTAITSTAQRLTATFPATVAPGPALIVLGDGYDDGWALSGITDARHLVVDGWANGWLVEDGSRLGGAEVTVEYRPGVWATVAATASAVAFVGVLGWMALATIASRRTRSQSRAG